MTNPSYIVTGTVTGENTVTLDESLPVKLDKVRLIIEPISGHQENRYRQVMAEIRQRQQARGYQPPIKAEVDQYLRQERDSWEQ